MGHNLFIVNIGRQKAGTLTGNMTYKAERWLHKEGFCDVGKFGMAKADYFTIPGGFGGALDFAAKGDDPWEAEDGPAVRQFKGEPGLASFIEEMRCNGDYGDVRPWRRQGLKKGDWLVAVDYHL